MVQPDWPANNAIRAPIVHASPPEWHDHGYDSRRPEAMPHRAASPAPPMPVSGVPAQSSAGHSFENPQHWQEAYLDLEQEKRRVQGELRERNEEIANLVGEAQRLKEQIQAEQERRRERTDELGRQLDSLERENRQLNMQLMKVQMQDSAKLTDVTTVKKEVVARTMELEKMMREFQQTHQEKLFARVQAVTGAMMAACHKPDLSSHIQTIQPAITEESLPPMPALRPSPASHGGGSAFGACASASAVACGGPSIVGGSPMPAVQEEEPAQGAFLDPETQQALKRRLQSLGDVVVYTSDKFEACCASGRAIPPNALRVRPRRCDHVFLVECLMPYWAEGLCPVCRCSFAYDRPQDAGYDDADRYSGVSTSVSQRPRERMHAASAMAFSRNLAASHGPGSDAGASLRGHRGRSSSIPRASRRRRSPHGGMLDAKSDISGRGAGSPTGIGRCRSTSPPRSVVSMASRASSAPRPTSPPNRAL